MIELLIEYGFFLLKVVTVLAVILIPLLMIVSSSRDKQDVDKGRIIVKNLSERLEEIGVSYKIIPINITMGEQFSKDYSTISPSNKIPSIIDTENNINILVGLSDTSPLSVDTKEDLKQVIEEMN